jgi:hypothetical protein
VSDQITIVDLSTASPTNIPVVQGPQGATGPQGTKGETGDRGLQGLQGVKGDTGDTGASAYQVAQANGFVGNAVAWLASLVGPQGTKGDTGAQGPQGPSGADSRIPSSGLIVNRVAKFSTTSGGITQSVGLFEDGSGNVGIGTTSPTATMDVLGNGQFGSSWSGAGIFLQTNGTVGEISGINHAKSSRNPLQFTTGITPTLYIGVGAPGNVGIGTTAPAEQVHASANIRADGKFIGINVAKAWVEFDGTTGTIKSAFNVTSVTRISTGTYTVTFTNAMADTNYAVLAIAASEANGSLIGGAGGSNKLTGSVRVVSTNPNVALSDSSHISVIILGN